MIIKKYKTIIPIALWTILIFSFSLQPAEISSELSSGFGTWLLEHLFPAMMEKVRGMTPEQLDFLHTLLRKIAHFSEYLVLGMISYVTFYHSNMLYKKFAAILYCIIVACADETIQLFVDGRAGRIFDVMIDTSGAVTGMICIAFIMHLFHNLIKKHQNQGA